MAMTFLTWHGDRSHSSRQGGLSIHQCVCYDIQLATQWSNPHVAGQAISGSVGGIGGAIIHTEVTTVSLANEMC